MVTPTAATVKFYGFEKVTAKAAKDIGTRLHSAQTVSTRAVHSELHRYQSSDSESALARPSSSPPPLRLCPRAGTPEARKAKRLEREAFEDLLRRLQTPTLSVEVATGLHSDRQQTVDLGRGGGGGWATAVADGAPKQQRGSSARLLKRMTRPTTASMHKRVGVCALCWELDLSSELYDCWTSGYDLVTAQELPAIVERLRSPTFSSGARSTPCRKCRSSAEAEADADSRPSSSSVGEPLLSGLRRSPTVKDIVDRLYKRRTASPDAASRLSARQHETASVASIA